MTPEPTSPSYDVIVAGHICLDIIPALNGGNFAFVPGKLIEAGAATTMLGGAVANTGLALNRLGVDVRLIGKVGDDLFGDAVRVLLGRQGSALPSGLVTEPGGSTSYSVIISPPDADRMFIHSTGCNATFTHADVAESALKSASLLHFGYPPLMEAISKDDGVELIKLLKLAKSTGVTTSLDLSMPDMNGPSGKVCWRKLLEGALPYVDIFLPSLDELALMLVPEVYSRWAASGRSAADCASAEFVSELGRELLEMGAKIVAIKLGHRGLYLRTASYETLADMGRAPVGDLRDWADRELWAPCFEVKLIGATGSGDATIAGFLFGLLRGFSAEETTLVACAVGACSVEALDSFSGIRSWPETQARMAAGWPQRSDGPNSNAWIPNTGRNVVWSGLADQSANGRVRGA